MHKSKHTGLVSFSHSVDQYVSTHGPCLPPLRFLVQTKELFHGREGGWGLEAGGGGLAVASNVVLAWVVYGLLARV